MALSKDPPKKTGSVVSRGKKVPQLEEHAKQSIPPLKVYNNKNLCLANIMGQQVLLLVNFCASIQCPTLMS
jgi:hypothetical protein